MLSQATLSKAFAGLAIIGLLIGSASVFFVGPSAKPSAVKASVTPTTPVLPTVVPSPTKTVQPSKSPSPTPSKKVKPSATVASPSAKASTSAPSTAPTTDPPRPQPTLTRSPVPKPTTPKPTPRPTTPSPTPTTPKPTPPPVTNQVTHVYQLINQERQKRGLGIIYRTDFLEASAARWTVQMANEGRMYHSNPLPRGVYGECVARGYITGDAVMAAWMNSPGHRDIILGNYSQVGVGYIAYGGWWTLQFA